MFQPIFVGVIIDFIIVNSLYCIIINAVPSTSKVEFFVGFYGNNDPFFICPLPTLKPWLFLSSSSLELACYRHHWNLLRNKKFFLHSMAANIYFFFLFYFCLFGLCGRKWWVVDELLFYFGQLITISSERIHFIRVIYLFILLESESLSVRNLNSLKIGFGLELSRFLALIYGRMLFMGSWKISSFSRPLLQSILQYTFFCVTWLFLCSVSRNTWFKLL